MWPLFCDLGVFEELPEFPDAFDVRLVALGTHRQRQDPLRPVQVRGAVAHVAEDKFELGNLLGRDAWVY